MLYGKLVVALLSTVAAEKNQSTNQHIARYILENRTKLAGMKIQQVARACGVGLGSISRFCREVGLNDFSELKELIAEIPIAAVSSPGQSYEQRVVRREHNAEASLSAAAEALLMPETKAKIAALCEDLRRYPRAAAFGMLRSESVAFGLQTEMIGCGKLIYTTLSYGRQIEYIESATKDDLILIFSNEGVYFEYQYPDGYPACLAAPKIYILTSGNRTYPPCIDEVIRLRHPAGQPTHPYYMQLAADVIVREYAARYGRPDFPAIGNP